MSDPDLRDLLLEHARRRAVQDSGEPVEVQLACVRAMLIAAFGEDDFAAALALEDATEAAGTEGPGRPVFAPQRPRSESEEPTVSANPRRRP